MKEKFLFVTLINYKVINNIGKQIGKVSILSTDLLLILGVKATVDGKSGTLYNIYNNSGLMCTTDGGGVEKLMEVLPDFVVQLNTYTIINGISKPNDTKYCNYTTISKVIPIKTNKGTFYECTTTSNFILFNTDEEGYRTILGLGDLQPVGPKKVIN